MFCDVTFFGEDWRRNEFFQKGDKREAIEAPSSHLQKSPDHRNESDKQTHISEKEKPILLSEFPARRKLDQLLFLLFLT